jgi:hypothetical protein
MCARSPAHAERLVLRKREAVLVRKLAISHSDLYVVRLGWMMMAMSADRFPDIDFLRIRPYGRPASRANGFEELASILIEQGVVGWPEGARFERFGNPDGGREGRGVLPNGDVYRD